jgi:protoporphyrinogen oxidase
VVDSQGFTWDLGGHVLFSHYPLFDALLDGLLEWTEHKREAWVWMCDRFIPYPLQHHLDQLPPALARSCQVQARTGGGSSANFHEWLVQNFGEGLCEAFMLPYNRKVWAYEPARLGAGWVGERVATLGARKPGWGPNARFRYPLRGATGAIWEALRGRLAGERLHLGQPLVSINTRRRRITLAGGREVAYDWLISTMPLDCLLRSMDDCPVLSAKADSLVYSSSHIVGLGVEGRVPEHLSTKSWMYFPEPQVPFYRATVFSNYSRYNVPRPGEQWSLLCEVSESPERPVRSASLVS